VTLEAELLDLDAVSAAPLAVTWHAGINPEASVPMMLLRDIVDNSQRHAIQQALSMQTGNWAAAARQLGLDASNLHKLAKRLGVKAP
jgi:anaerobic nitric oxide reductase transcription regulator